MKKILAVLCTLAMLISMFSFTAMAEGEDVTFTSFCSVTDESNAYAFVTLTNNSSAAVNLYDLSIGYAGKENASRIKEITEIAGGLDWVESGMTGVPANPDAVSLGAGESVVLWWYQAGAYGDGSAPKQVADFRTYWGLAEDVLVICVDGYEKGSTDANFKLNVKSEGTYILMNLNGETTLTADQITQMKETDSCKVDPAGGVGAMKETISYITIGATDITGDVKAVYAVSGTKVDLDTKLADLSALTLAKVAAAPTPDTTPGGDDNIDDTADINTAPLYAVLVLGIAVVAFASKKRFAR